jgi:hypothetical protein
MILFFRSKYLIPALWFDMFDALLNFSKNLYILLTGQSTNWSIWRDEFESMGGRDD